MKPKDQTELSAFFGESVTVQKVNGRLVVKIRRKRNMDNPTENQVAYKAKFLVASGWASNHVENKENKAFYEARITKKRQSAYSLALKDFSKPPKVDAITLKSTEDDPKVGDLISIEVFDLFMVTKVDIVITDPSGNKIEEGEAVLRGESYFWWEYALKVANPAMKGVKIRATAYDRPGHTGTLEVVL